LNGGGKKKNYVLSERGKSGGEITKKENTLNRKKKIPIAKKSVPNFKRESIKGEGEGVPIKEPRQKIAWRKEECYRQQSDHSLRGKKHRRGKVRP